VGADAIHGPQLRRARPADAPFITALFIASRRTAMPWLPVLHDLEATVAFFRDVVPTRAEVWVEAGAGGELVGFIAFGGGELRHLYVAPGCQGKGPAPGGSRPWLISGALRMADVRLPSGVESCPVINRTRPTLRTPDTNPGRGFP
jgi:hypothetical protein